MNVNQHRSRLLCGSLVLLLSGSQGSAWADCGTLSGTPINCSSTNVGIGTISPPTSLLQTYTPSITANTDVLTLQAGFYSAINVEQRIKFDDVRGFHLAYLGAGSIAGTGGYLAFGTAVAGPGVAPVERMRIDNAGNVGIGTATMPYRLSVDGAIGARDVIVTNAQWSDYVFQPGHQLQPLSEVNAFIQANRHLPEIPSEAEVKEKGVSVGEMQAKLLAKIEELTLHMIAEHERNNRLESENRELHMRMERMEQRVEGKQ